MELYDFQKQIISTAQHKWGIFAEVGLGKSAICLTLANMHARSVLIVTTKSLKRNWQNEVTMWIKKPMHIKVVSKEEFRRDWETYGYYEAIIMDEFHFFGNFKSQLHKAAKNFIRKNNPLYVWGATATPILSSVMSVWALSFLLGRPLQSFMGFQLKYHSMVRMNGRMIPMQKKGIENLIAEDIKKIGTVMKKEDAIDLPESVHEFEWFDLTHEQKRAIKQLDNDPTTIVPIVYHTKCLQIANGSLKREDGGFDEIKCEKMTRVLELVELYPKCVVVCRQTAELEMLHAKIPNSFIYNGQTPIEERDEIIRKVNAGEGTMLANAEMLIGFNLVGISLMIYYSHSWDFVKYYQSLGRTHRIGQVNKCTYIHLITQGSIDESVWQCLEKKENFDIAMYNRDTI